MKSARLVPPFRWHHRLSTTTTIPRAVRSGYERGTAAVPPAMASASRWRRDASQTAVAGAPSRFDRPRCCTEVGAAPRSGHVRCVNIATRTTHRFRLSQSVFSAVYLHNLCASTAEVRKQDPLVGCWRGGGYDHDPDSVGRPGGQGLNDTKNIAHGAGHPTTTPLVGQMLLGTRHRTQDDHTKK